MALILRLASMNVQRQLLSAQRCGVVLISKTQSSRTPQCEGMDGISTEGHDAKNMRLGRPQSPHLTIYAPQMTTLLSISHRGTGMILSGYLILFGLSTLVLPDTISNYLDDLDCLCLGAIPLMIGKVAICFPLVYHYWNGIRHMFWDMNKFLNINEVRMTGWVMLLLTFATTAGLVLLGNYLPSDD